MKSIGLDIHSASFTYGVISEKGGTVQCLSRETTKQNLIEAIAEVKGKKQLVVEECHMAQWVKDILEPYVDKLIVCDPTENKWITAAQHVDDKISAIRLAKLLQGGYIKEIVHPDSKAAVLRHLFLHYFDITRYLVDFKNKMKATYRSVAIPTDVKGFYTEAVQDKMMKELKDYPHLESQALDHLIVKDLLEGLKKHAFDDMKERVERHKCYKWLRSIPGVGPVIASGYLALVETPYRFSRRNKLWSYAGFGNKRHTSDEVVYTHHASKNGCRALKWVVIEHFNSAVILSKTPNRFNRQYSVLRSHGLGPTAARRQVCRSILSVVRAVWMKEEPYRDEELTTPSQTKQGK